MVRYEITKEQDPTIEDRLATVAKQSLNFNAILKALLFICDHM